MASLENGPAIVGDNLVIETTLEIGAVRIRGDVVKLNAPKLDDAISIAEKFLDLTQYEQPKAEQFLSFYPKDDRPIGKTS